MVCENRQVDLERTARECTVDSSDARCSGLLVTLHIRFLHMVPAGRTPDRTSGADRRALDVLGRGSDATSAGRRLLQRVQSHTPFRSTPAIQTTSRVSRDWNSARLPTRTIGVVKALCMPGSGGRRLPTINHAGENPRPARGAGRRRRDTRRRIGGRKRLWRDAAQTAG
jgi:hypothetical protein